MKLATVSSLTATAAFAFTSRAARLVGTALGDEAVGFALGEVRARTLAQMGLVLADLRAKDHGGRALEQLAASSLVLTGARTIAFASTSLLGKLLATTRAARGAETLSQFLGNNLALVSTYGERVHHRLAAIGASEELANQTRAALIAALVVVTGHGNLVAIKVQLGVFLAHVAEEGLDTSLSEKFIHSLAKLRQFGGGRAGSGGIADTSLFVFGGGLRRVGGLGRVVFLGELFGGRVVGRVHSGIVHRAGRRMSRLVVRSQRIIERLNHVWMRMLRRLWIRSVLEKVVGQSRNVITPRRDGALESV